MAFTLLVLYFVHSLSVIKKDLKLIKKHFDIREDFEEAVPNEQIERELEKENSRSD